MKLLYFKHRRIAVVLMAAIAAVCIAGCGGSSSPSAKTTKSTTTASGKTASTSRTGLVTCLKQHGVTLPTGGFGHFHRGTGTGTTTTGTPPAGGGQGGGGFPGGGGGGRGFFGGNSKFATAFKDCAKFDTGGRFGGGRFGGGGFAGRFKPSTKVLDSYVACLRKNGDPSMPEPATTSPPFPASAETTAGFKKAEPKCQSIVLKAFRRPGGAPPGQTGVGTGTVTASST